MPAPSNKMAPGKLTTPWTAEVDPHLPHPEYPRPQMVRSSWQNLNGLWDYAITSRFAENPETYQGQILVPYPVESALSGVEQSLSPKQLLWYHRTFEVNPVLEEDRILLHFGAVDWHCRVYLNNEFVGEHFGGYDPFTFDITDWIIEGENDLLISVWDPTDALPIQRGKQVLKPGFIWYSAHSGIWQIVWLEYVPETYIESIKMTPDIDKNRLTLKTNLSSAGGDLTIKSRVFDQGNCIVENEADPQETIHIPINSPKLWSPDSPHLYDLEITLREGDKVIDQIQSYFGMRKFSLEKDQNGIKRFCLNNQTLFLYGPLDQGFWPDGLCTPPTDQAIQWELDFLKKAGFNMLRKHVKIEPARYYYHCDRVGLIVWQDMVSGGISPKPLWFFFARLFKNLSDDRAYWRFKRQQEANRDQFRKEYKRMILSLYNTTSIAIWGPFNEGWGQFDSAQIADWTKELDPTRLVDHASGWFDQGAGDFKSDHVYFKPLPEPSLDPNRGWVLSEFGGYSLNLTEHAWNPDKDFGYKKFETKESLTRAYIELIEVQLVPWIKAGLSAAVYTQTTDVETEVNGFLTYDRKVVKMNMEVLTKVHEKILQVSQEQNIKST